MVKKNGMVYPLGATVINDGVNFSVAVESGKKCALLLYKTGEKEPLEKIELEENAAQGEMRAVMLTDLNPVDYEYNYFIDGECVVDPYVKLLAGRENWGELPEDEHSIRGKIVLDDYNWEGDEPVYIPYNEVIAYSLHVRGFTKHVSSKVKHKGTFLGVQEKIPYMKELGINQIHCMPVYEFEENDKYVNYWGYGPAFCFAPKSAYAASKNAQKELKDLVKACHKEGIEIVLDMPFVGGMTYRMISDCIRYYKIEYHIDGFIINTYNISMEELRRDPLLKHTKIMKKQDDFQNVMRRFLKGDEGMVRDVMWWQRHLSKDDGIFNYITNHTGFTLCDLVSYDGKHNEKNGEKNQDGPEYNYSWNCGAEGPSRRKAVVELRNKQMRNAFMLLLLAQGTPCILAGDEFHNSQNGNNNVYCQDNETGWVNWNKLGKDKDFFEYVKSLIKFRKEHPILSPEHELTGIDRTSCGVPDISYHGEAAWQVPAEVSSRQLGIFYSGQSSKENDCFVAYNMHWLEHSFALPALKREKNWYLAVSTTDGVLEEEKLLENQKEVVLGERTIAIFVGR